MASLQKVLRPVGGGAISRRLLGRPLSTATALRTNVSNSPPRDPPAQPDIGVGELEGAKFRIEPMRRVGEDEKTMRARLVYQSRKRGTLESDLLLSTFADAYLPGMTKEQMQQYDLFLDENDWDIYYWATQEAPTAPAGGPAGANAAAASEAVADEPYRKPGEGEWAQTVGTFKPAYRPVPARWQDSDILAQLREHVKRRSKGGAEGKGMGFMPKLRS